MASTLERVKLIIADYVGIESKDIQDTSTFESLGLDSLDAIETIMAVENEFEIDIPDEEAAQLDTGTVEFLVKYVDGKIAGRAPEEPSEFD